MMSLVVSIVLFTIGVGGVISRRDLLRLLISVSIMLGSITLLLVTLANQHATMTYSIVILVWSIEVVEIIIAISIFLSLAKNGSTNVNELTELKW